MKKSQHNPVSKMDGQSPNKTGWLAHPALICILLAGVTLAVFWPARHFDFVDFDDDQYVTGIPQVTGGITLEGVRWAFTHFHFCNWHPLTTLSHMLDCQFWGLNAGGHHLTSILFHSLNAMLLFWLLRSLTGAQWRSAVVAALFALHPLHVEPVAWIASRKDVLSTFFGFLSLIFYARYVESKTRNSKFEIRSPKSEVFSLEPSSILHPPSSLSYFLALFFFACSLMSKPMLVTLPFVMLLLDYWPLSRVPSLKSQVSSPAVGAMQSAIGNPKFGGNWCGRRCHSSYWRWCSVWLLSRVSGVAAR